MFFEKLLELAISLWDLLKPIVVMDPYEGGLVLRMGSHNRTLGEGWHWKWPLIETVAMCNTCTTTMRMPFQTVTTSDGVGVVGAVVVKYAIKDVEPYLLEIYDAVDVLADVTMGAVLKALTTATYDQLRAELPEAAILTALRKQVNRYGFKVESVTFTDFGKVRSIRLVADHAANLGN